MQLHRSELRFTCTRTAVRLANRDLLLRAILLACGCVGRLGCVLEGAGLTRGRQHLLPAVQVSAAKTCLLSNQRGELARLVEALSTLLLTYRYTCSAGLTQVTASFAWSSDRGCKTQARSLMQLRGVLVIYLLQSCIGARLYGIRAGVTPKVPSTCVHLCCCSTRTNGSSLMLCRWLHSLATADLMAHTLVEWAYAAAASCSCHS